MKSEKDVRIQNIQCTFLCGSSITRLTFDMCVCVLFRVEPPMYIHDTRLLVGWQGNVTWVKECRYRFNCKTQPNEDSPTCALRFGSWAFDSTRLKLQSPSDRIDASHYIAHHDWELSKNTALFAQLEAPYPPGVKYDSVTFEFELLKRVTEDETDENDESGARSILSQGSSSGLLLTALLSVSAARFISTVR